MLPQKIVAVTVLAAVLLAGLLGIYFLQPKNLDSTSLENMQQTQETKKVEDVLAEKRKTYNISLGVFEDLPHAPGDFSSLIEKMHKGNYTNYAFFPETYFLQPEFYPSFNEATRAYWVNPSLTHYGAAGYGFYPSYQQVSLLPGQSATTAFFAHTAFGVQNYQGLKVVAKNNYEGITVSVIEPEFVLGYSYPKFSNTWAKKVLVIIFADKNALPGEYKLDFSAQAFPANDANSNRNFTGGGGSAGISSTILVKILNEQ